MKQFASKAEERRYKRAKAPLCSICGVRLVPWLGGGGYGNNAAPINDGRCCDVCNATKVIPARIAQLYGGKDDEAIHARVAKKRKR